MSVLQKERQARGGQAKGTLLAAYRSELAATAAERGERLQQAEAAGARIASMLPGAVDAGLSMAELARLTGYSRATLYRTLAETRGEQDLATRLASLQAELAAADKALGHPALSLELASYLGIAEVDLRARLTAVFGRAAEDIEALGSTGTTLLLDLLPGLPHQEKIIVKMLFFDRASLEDIALSMNQPLEEVMVWGALALLRLLSELRSTDEWG